MDIASIMSAEWKGKLQDFVLRKPTAKQAQSELMFLKEQALEHRQETDSTFNESFKFMEKAYNNLLNS